MQKYREHTWELYSGADYTLPLLFPDERDPSKWLAYLSEGKVGTSSTGETMWLLDLSQPALTHQGIVPISQDGTWPLFWSI
jgi:hypothetical protein